MGTGQEGTDPKSGYPRGGGTRCWAGGGAGSGHRRGAAGDARGARPPSESVRPSENRCGERCPLTVTFKALSPRPPRPAHEPPHALPSAGEGRIWPPVPPPKAQGGPKGPGAVSLRTPPPSLLFLPPLQHWSSLPRASLRYFGTLVARGRMRPWGPELLALPGGMRRDGARSPAVSPKWG